MSSTAALGLHPYRLLPAEPGLRSTARQLYQSVKDLPIISPHGHVPAQWLADDIPFADPTSLLITPDHYVNRLLHAHGVELSALGVGQASLTEQASRQAFRILCAHWERLPRHPGPLLAGRPAGRHLRGHGQAQRGDR